MTARFRYWGAPPSVAAEDGDVSRTASSGAVTGTPNATGTSNFSVAVTDIDGAASPSQALSLTFNAPPALTITTTSLPGGMAGSEYSIRLQATGGYGAYTWSISAGSLPFLGFARREYRRHQWHAQILRHDQLHRKGNGLGADSGDRHSGSLYYDRGAARAHHHDYCVAVPVVTIFEQ